MINITTNNTLIGIRVHDTLRRPAAPVPDVGAEADLLVERQAHAVTRQELAATRAELAQLRQLLAGAVYMVDRLGGEEDYVVEVWE